MVTLQEINGNARKINLAYEKALSSLVKETDMPHTAISILLFIANNPDLATASDICALRGLKKPIVSTHVERLVVEGYVERRGVPGDRRKYALVCTEKAHKIIQVGREIQFRFAETLLEGINVEDRAVMERCFKRMNENIDKLIREK